MKLSKVNEILDIDIWILLFSVGLLMVSTLWIEYSSVIRWALGISGALLALSVSAQMIIQQIIKRRGRK